MGGRAVGRHAADTRAVRAGLRSGVPLGTFAEDYEFVAGAGDLDASNGRTDGSGDYAYYLTGAYPYLIADRYHGTPEAPQRSGRVLSFHSAARYLEYVHEKPVHLIVVSEDLADFAHIHPEPGAAWRALPAVYDYTTPGAPGRVDRVDVTVPGPAATKKADSPEFGERFTAGTRRSAVPGAGRDRTVPGGVGAFIAVDETLDTFLHAHRTENEPNLAHTHAAPGPENEPNCAAEASPRGTVLIGECSW